MAATTTTATTASSTSFYTRQRPSVGRGCTAKLDGVGMWIVNGFSAAFFASLERLSCIRLATQEDEGDGTNDAVPLIHNEYAAVMKHGNSNGHSGIGRRNKGKGVRKEMNRRCEDF